MFRELGLHIDASSDFEVERAIAGGIRAGRDPAHLADAVAAARRARPAAASSTTRAPLHQLDSFGRVAPGREVSVRMNPGLGTGSTKRTNTGGPASSFGIWHEYLDEVKAIAERHRLRITRLHSHVGLRHRPRDLEALHPDDARARGEAARRGAPSTWAAGSRWGACPRSRRSISPTWARTCARSSWPSRPGTAGASASRSSPARTSSRDAGAVVASCIDVVDTGRERLPVRQARHRHDRGHAPVALRRPAPDRRPRPGTARRPRSSSWDRAASRATSSRRRRAIPRRSRPAGCRGPRSATWSWSSGAGAYCAAMSTINYNSYPHAPEVHAGAGRHPAPAPAPPGARGGLGRRGLRGGPG